MHCIIKSVSKAKSSPLNAAALSAFGHNAISEKEDNDIVLPVVDDYQKLVATMVMFMKGAPWKEFVLAIFKCNLQF
jgi:hypothetical protein